MLTQGGDISPKGTRRVPVGMAGVELNNHEPWHLADHQCHTDMNQVIDGEIGSAIPISQPSKVIIILPASWCHQRQTLKPCKI